MVNDREIIIADQTLNFDQLQFELKEDQILVQINSLYAFKKSQISILFKDSTLKKKASLKFPIDKLTTALVRSPDFDFICFEFNSQFSELQACKKLNPTAGNSIFLPSVLIDGQPFQRSGIVVLKNKDERVLFQAQLSENNLVELRTKKRTIVPKSIQKMANNEEFKVIFQDLETKENLSWNDSININQSFFNIELDPILNLKQDIYFTGKRLKESSLNYVRTESQKPQGPSVYLHSTTFEPFGIYQSAVGSANKLNASVASNFGQGFKIDHRWLVNRNLDAQIDGYTYQTLIISDSANLVNNTTQFFYSAAGGLSYHLRENFDLLGQVVIRKDLFFKVNDQNTKAVDIISGLNKIISVTPRWTFYKNLNSSALLDLGLNYLLPTTADTESVQAGTSVQFGFNYSYEFIFGHLKFETYYLRRAQNSQTFNFSEQAAFYGLGYQYFF